MHSPQALLVCRFFLLSGRGAFRFRASGNKIYGRFFQAASLPAHGARLIRRIYGKRLSYIYRYEKNPRDRARQRLHQAARERLYWQHATHREKRGVVRRHLDRPDSRERGRRGNFHAAGIKDRHRRLGHRRRRELCGHHCGHAAVSTRAIGGGSQAPKRDVRRRS